MNNLQELFKPINDLVGGVDGGVAFAVLYHSTLPELQKMADSGNIEAIKFVECLSVVSKLCVVHLNNKK